ncbi:MAG: hypothetical protein KGK10_09780 [Rhodospirillales bacterium]|nr:hypothetical protein [Rhodospirillales bacterium]
MRAAWLLSAFLLAGCALIDQRTFEARRSVPASAALTAGAASRPLAISDGSAGWPARLAAVARDASIRDPAVRFDLLARVPLGGTQAARAAARARQEGQLQQAATALEAVGIDASRIRLGLRGDPGNPGALIELYAR